MNSLVAEIISTARLSMTELRQRITNVRYGKEDGNEILFDFDGQPRASRMVGRNADLVLGLSPEADAAIALRCLLDEER